MLRLLADENFNSDIVRGLRLRQAKVDLVRVPDVGLAGADDHRVLDWAAANTRIVLTHDRASMPKFAFERVNTGLDMAGVFVVGNRLPVGAAIQEVALLAECSDQEEWRGMVAYLPL